MFFGCYTIDTMIIRGTYLKKLREERGITLRTFSADTGIPHPSLSAMERGKYAVPEEIIEKIATYLKIDPAILYVGHHVLPPHAREAANKNPKEINESLKRATKRILRE